MNANYVLTIALLTAPIAVHARADEFDVKLRAAAKDVYKFVKAKKCENVGVLKFLVDKGDGKLADNAGDLNRGVADRLEVAMILEWPSEDIGIIYQASDEAKKIAGANHLTPEGRKAFFGHKYALAWGPDQPDDRVTASLFLTGNVVISKDLKKTAVAIQAFGPAGALERVTSFEIQDTPLRVLIETGRSYLVPQGMVARGLKKDEVKNTVVEQSIALDSGNPPPKPKPSLES